MSQDRPDDLIAPIRARVAAATPGPWRWAGHLSPDHFDLPELRAGGQRVMAFVTNQQIRTVYADTFEAADIPLSDALQEDITFDAAQDRPAGVLIDETGQPDPDGRFLAYLDRGPQMSFTTPQVPWAVTAVGKNGVPVRWDCFNGQTADQAGRQPYRHDIRGIDNPDAELIANARADLDTLLAHVEEARVLLDALVGHESSPCLLDHHGFCQEHPGGFDEQGCVTARARKLLGQAASDVKEPTS